MLNDVSGYKFLIVKCRDCGFSFGITPEQQQWLYERQLGLFSHCPECREKRRIAKANGQDGEAHG